MRYIIDNDLHVHTRLSICSKDEGQTPAAILEHEKARGIKRICIADHYWDSAVPVSTIVNWWYEKQNYDHIAQSLPLPQDPDVEMLFGCEADVDSLSRVGVPPQRYDDFDFIVIPTTHFNHMTGPAWEDTSPQALAAHWVQRLDAVLNTDLPFKKTGIAHLACPLVCRGDHEGHLAALDAIPQAELDRLFTKAAALGVGIEINAGDFLFADEEAEHVLRIFRTAKACGCKFYLASDAHGRESFAVVDGLFNRAIDLLELQESDKFIPARS